MKNWQQFKELSVPLREGKFLLPWQRLGVVFLHFCRSVFGYALLGDEMGVGKVLKVIKRKLILDYSNAFCYLWHY